MVQPINAYPPSISPSSRNSGVVEKSYNDDGNYGVKGWHVGRKRENIDLRQEKQVEMAIKNATSIEESFKRTTNLMEEKNAK